MLGTLVPEFEPANQAPDRGIQERAQAREP